MAIADLPPEFFGKMNIGLLQNRPTGYFGLISYSYSLKMQNGCVSYGFTAVATILAQNS